MTVGLLELLIGWLLVVVAIVAFVAVARRYDDWYDEQLASARARLDEDAARRPARPHHCSVVELADARRRRDRSVPGSR